MDLKYTPNEKALIRYIHQGYKSSFGHPKIKLERRYEKLSLVEKGRLTCTNVKQMINELEKSDDEEAGIEIEKAIAWFATPEGKETKEKIEQINKETRKKIKKLEKSWPERMLNRVNRYQSEHPYQYLILLLTWPICLTLYISFKVFSVFFAITSLIDPTMRFLDGDTPGFLSPGDGKIDIPDDKE